MARCLCRSSLPTLKTFLRPTPAKQQQQQLQCLLPTLFLQNLSNIRWIANDVGPDEGVLPRSVPVRVAHELLQAGHRYLDVRTAEEFNAGHPVGAANIPYMFKVESGMTKNPQFLEEVSSVYGKADEIIIGCKSGRRSLMAAADLLSAGYTGVKDIAGGYLSWVQNGLPTHR